MQAGPPPKPGNITLTNRRDRSLTLIVEERGWAHDALTADRVSTYQAFRDLFSRKVFRPGDTGDIDHITLMFTDLKGSTALYNRINTTTDGEPLIIRLGLHAGRCIAVTLNDRLDYYGATANLTARLESQSQGGDIILSQSLAQDPAVRDALKEITLEKGEA